MDDLDEALLGGGRGQGAGRGAAEQALAGQPQEGVVLGGGPGEVAMLEGALDGGPA